MPGAGREERGPAESSYNYAEVLADGVRAPTGLNYMLCLCPVSRTLAEVPAASLHHFGAVARAEVGNVKTDLSKKNASRDAHAFIATWGLMWKVPLSYLEHQHGEDVSQIAYIDPKDFMIFLVEKAPELLMGGCPSPEVGRSHLAAFWQAYEKLHPTHRLFNISDDLHRSPASTFPLALHGDEGRGLKKGNTTVLTMESPLGTNTWSNVAGQRSACHCTTCSAHSGPVNSTRLATGCGAERLEAATDHACAFQAFNLRGHSFLPKFVLAIMPRKDNDLLDKLSRIITRSFIKLYHEGFVAGGVRWYAACIGMKGDAKWFQKVGTLSRSFSSQISVGTAMCHECMAGTPAMPFEDAGHEPLWMESVYTQRPFAIPPVWCHIPFEDASRGNNVLGGPCERYFRRDIFHVCKVGIFRYYLASTVMLLARLGYWSEPGTTNKRDILLQRAHRSFQWYCSTAGGTPSLRSFSESFFNVKTWDSYGWINCKASDTSLLMAWVCVLLTGFLNDLKSESHRLLLETMLSAAMEGRAFMRMTYEHGLWMPRRCAWTFYHHVHRFLHYYNKAAFLSLHRFKYTGYATTGKYHMLAHIKTEVLGLLKNPNVQWIPNAQLWGCEGNEDVVGLLSRLNRRVSARTSTKRTLQLYLTKAKAVHRRFLKNRPS